MTDNPATSPSLGPGVVALVAVAALAALSMTQGQATPFPGRLVITGAAALLAASSAIAILAGGTGRWFRVALAVAVIGASAGVLARHLSPETPPPPPVEAAALPAPAETARAMPESPPPGPTPEGAEQIEEAARTAGANGNLAESVALFEQAIAARERLGDPLKAAFARVNLALSLKKMGRNDDARAVLGEALPVLDALPGDHPARATARSLAAELGD